MNYKEAVSSMSNATEDELKKRIFNQIVQEMGLSLEFFKETSYSEIAKMNTENFEKELKEKLKIK